MEPYKSIPNSFKKSLLDKEILIGCWCSMASTVSIEIIGQAGFDWLLIDGEHSPNDLQSFIHQLMALKDSPSAPVVRPQSAEPIIIKRLLDSGVSNFLMPFISTEEEAKLAVSSTRYPPEGIRGVSMMQRANKFGYVEDYYNQANENITVAVQIENHEGVSNVDAIAQVEGVDALFIGPSDLSAAYGLFGDPMHPDVQGAIQRVCEAAQTAGKPVGILAGNEEHARKYLDMGMTFVAVGIDLVLFKNATLDLRKKYKA